MSVRLLDCTLRDGGYANNWEFGRDAIPEIVGELIESKADIIECGYLTEKFPGSCDKARYNSLADFYKIAGNQVKASGASFALMINFGEFDVHHLPPAAEGSPIIRLAFHKRDLSGALEYINNLLKLGYKVFAQPMGVHNYSDEEFEEKRARYEYARPFTKESLLYREIFEKYYPGQAEMVVDFWMPNKNWEGCNVNDPSARVLANYGASGE